MNLLANNTPLPPSGGDINQCHLGEKNRKRGREVVRNGRKEKENEKRGSKRVNKYKIGKN
jgi:hypothetical protein